jgi:hypothetical protein
MKACRFVTVTQLAECMYQEGYRPRQNAPLQEIVNLINAILDDKLGALGDQQRAFVEYCVLHCLCSDDCKRDFASAVALDLVGGVLGETTLPRNMQLEALRIRQAYQGR